MPRALSRAWDRAVRWWWWLWTGEPSLDRMRNRLEHDVRRFGGRVTWED